MQFLALGPLTLLTDGRVVDVRPGRQPLLLACLLARANRVVRSETLADVLWPSGGVDVHEALRPVVSRLRHCLDAEPGGRGRLVTRPTGYELLVAPGELDVQVFEADLHRGRDDLRAGRYAEAGRALAEALGGWRGPAYADFGEVALLRSEVARLEELRTAAAEDQVEVELALGHEDDAAAMARTLVEDEPFRERRWEQLMLALYRGGRQAEALAAFRDARGLLADELGLAPGRGLVELERRVLRHDPTLDRDAGTDGASERGSVSGAAPTLPEDETQRRTGAGREDVHGGGGPGPGRPRLVLDAALVGGRGSFPAPVEVDRERLEILRRASAFVTGVGLRARVLAELAAELSRGTDSVRAGQVAEEALRCARRSLDPAVLVDVGLRCASTSLGDPGRQAERHAALAEVLVALGTGDEPGRRFVCSVVEAVCAAEQLDGDRVVAAHARMRAEADRSDDLTAVWLAAVAGSWGALLGGDVEGARHLCRRAFETGSELGRRDAWTVHHLQLLHVEWHAGRPDAMLAAAMHSATDSVDARVAWAMAVAGRTAAAAETLRAAYVLDFPSLAPSQRLADLSAWAAAAAELADEPAAERLTALLEPWSDRVAVTGGVVHPCVAHHLGRLAHVLGDDDRARDRLSVALRRHRSLGAPFFVRQTSEALARVRGRPAVRPG